MQAALHEAAKDYHPSTPPDARTEYSAMSHRLHRVSDLWPGDSLGQVVYEQLHDLQRQVVVPLQTHYRHSRKLMIHADLTMNNILFLPANEISGVLDFGDCREGVPEEDVGVLLWDICNRVDLADVGEVATFYLDTYLAFTRLTAFDRAASKICTLCCDRGRMKKDLPHKWSELNASYPWRVRS
jgi:Ser/Thr protein kinase RdoA (MazF antagonist)